jgi:hypothetical protein
MKTVPTTKRYLGRGISVDHDARGLVLTSENRFGVINTVILEPEVFLELLEYLGIEPRRGIRDTRRA